MESRAAFFGYSSCTEEGSYCDDPSAVVAAIRSSRLPRVLQFAEIAAFSSMTWLAAGGSKIWLAAHQVVANVANMLFMMPLALAMAATVTVSHSVGTRNAEMERLQTNIARVASALTGVMLCVVTLLLRPFIVEAYVEDVAVQQAAHQLLFWVAISQLGDTLLVLYTGLLRAYQITTSPAIVAIVCWWGLGVGLGYLFAFYAGPLGVEGLWIGQLIAISSAALVVGVLHNRYLARDRLLAPTVA